MKRIITILVLIILVAVAFISWKVIGPATGFAKEKKYIYIKTGSDYKDVLASLEKDSIVSGSFYFNLVANRLDYPQKVKAGKYPVKKGMSVLNIVRMLRNGQQEPVKLVVIKYRTKEDLASAVGKRFECDSTAFIHFLNNTDSLKQYGLDSNTVMTTVFPDTYNYFWNTTPSRIFSKLRAKYESYWTADRITKAKELGLTPQTAYTLASIVEEETLKKEDKGKISSVYLNRINKGMRLAADPTVKYALREFGLKRIYEKHLSVESPYNTYKYAGLPPGPICTPSEETIDAVLATPSTKYLFFVAKPGLSGYSNFAENYSEHLKFAREYQQWLDKFMQQQKPVDDNLAH
jgi:UPF0755 protein